MPQVGTIRKLAGSKYLSLYQMDAVQRDGKPPQRKTTPMAL